MSENDRRREKKRGLFGRKTRRSDTGSLDGDSSSANRSGDGHKKKKGFGRQIRRLVGGRKKSKRSGDDASAVEVFDKDDTNNRTPGTSLDAQVYAQIPSKGGDPNSDDGPHIATGRFGSIDEGDEDDEEPDSDKDEMLYGSGEEEDDASDVGELVGPLEIVLVLVDPKSLRFELLQLEFETPQLSKVSECLEQVKDIVTESALKSLEFHSVLDRNGNSFPAKVGLGKALTCRRRGKDILVGISKGISADEAGRLARPILGDAKVMEMLETNGYRVKGWAKDPKQQSELQDSQKDRFVVSERKRQLRMTSILFGLALIAYFFHQIFFSASPNEVLGKVIKSK